MNINCVICAELFTQSANASFTPCGHIFHTSCLLKWMERSKSCPQCRNACTSRNIHRAYFNTANADTSKIEVNSVIEELDNVKLQLREKDCIIEDAKKNIKNLEKNKEDLTIKMKVLEKTTAHSAMLIRSYREQLSILKMENKNLEVLKEEKENLQQKVELMNSIQQILTASTVEVDKIAKETRDIKVLASWAITLKRELVNSENKKADLRRTLSTSQQKYKKELEEKKTLTEKLNYLESENYRLSEDIKKYKEKSTTITSDQENSLNDDSKNSILETSTFDETNIRRKVRKIVESDSPYYKIKSCSILRAPLLTLKQSQKNLETLTNKTTNLKPTTIDLSYKNSILQNRRVLGSTANILASDRLKNSQKNEIVPKVAKTPAPYKFTNFSTYTAVKKN